MIVTQVAGWARLWAVQRLAMHARSWFAIATSQLASGALGRVVPGGAAATAALQYRMLWQAGLSRPAVATGLAAGSILLLGALASLPLLAVPALVAGRKIPDGLLNAGILALVIFVFLFALGALLIVSDRVVRWVGRTVTAACSSACARATRRRRTCPSACPSSASSSAGRSDGSGRRPSRPPRPAGCSTSSPCSRRSRPSTRARGCRSRCSPTAPRSSSPRSRSRPGGLGIVEAGMTGTLALAGVPAGAAAVAVLAYRMASYWLPLPIGAVAWYLHRRRFGEEIELARAPA